MLLADIWKKCLSRLRDELSPQQVNTWIRPLQLDFGASTDNVLCLVAPNRFVFDWVSGRFSDRITELVREVSGNPTAEVGLQIASAPRARFEDGSAALSVSSTRGSGMGSNVTVISTAAEHTAAVVRDEVDGGIKHRSYLNPAFTFDNFVEGKSNQMARAAALQVSENASGAYNPLFLYGGVGLGKTHLMHAVGNALLRKNPDARVVYLSSERFVADMVKALQLGAMQEFKKFYRSLDALLIDDIQFLARKSQSQEEFFHTYNALLEGGKQMIFTCDRYPREINDMEERLRSRFSWGLTLSIDPPELEMRVAILMKKAEQSGLDLPPEVAFFMAQRIRSQVRDLEGALKRVIASAHFTGRPLDLDLVKDSLKDMLAHQEKLVSVTNIQATVAEYYKIKTKDMLSARRSRSVARPRQMAMTLAKDLTNHSLPEIGEEFGGRDHTTVLHACRKIRELKDINQDIAEDYKNLLRLLTT